MNTHHVDCPLCDQQIFPGSDEDPTQLELLAHHVATDCTAAFQRRRALARAAPDGVTLGVERQALAGGESLVLLIYPERGTFHVHGIRSFNAPDEIQIGLVSSHSLQRSLSARSFDSASYALHGELAEQDPQALLAYYPAPWGAITREQPLQVTFRACGVPAVLPRLRWTLYGDLVVPAPGDPGGARPVDSPDF